MPVLEMNASGNTTAVNTFGPTGLLSRIVGATVYYVFDPQGSVASRLNGSQTVLSSDQYDAYGNRWQGDTTDVFAYGAQAGYYRDTETGLYLCTFRYYDPRDGRFLTRDPIGYDGGINLYGYVRGNPVNAIDPLGLKPGAAIFVGSTTVVLGANWAVDCGTHRDVWMLSRRFEKAGYDVSIDWQATSFDIAKQLKDPNVKAMAFIGHEASPGALSTYPIPNPRSDTDNAMYPDDFKAVLGKRRLDWAIIHACESDDPELRGAIVGTHGRWEASKGYWQPVLGFDLGSRTWWKGKWNQKHHPGHP